MEYAYQVLDTFKTQDCAARQESSQKKPRLTYEEIIVQEKCSGTEETQLREEEYYEHDENGELGESPRYKTERSGVWTEAATKQLILIYKHLYPKIQSGQLATKNVWPKLESLMQENNYHFSSKQIATKVDTLKRRYKDIKDYNAKSGNDLKSWMYYDDMEDIFGTQPWARPLSTVSSATKTASELDDEATGIKYKKGGFP
ncbi:unnamed protein product [Brassicogethes aeneus]|uniref:Myb/SANT-like DNA-binding domain-containing protein n=1 Tax=Brassicogethes aeneus TaxID=1431903 RepID=A0A9P0AZ52_BRAAE|nr:unnamed protein product [Brassicogethes aeneus]